MSNGPRTLSSLAIDKLDFETLHFLLTSLNFGPTVKSHLLKAHANQIYYNIPHKDFRHKEEFYVLNGNRHLCEHYCYDTFITKVTPHFKKKIGSDDFTFYLFLVYQFLTKDIQLNFLNSFPFPLLRDIILAVTCKDIDPYTRFPVPPQLKDLSRFFDSDWYKTSLKFLEVLNNS